MKTKFQPSNGKTFKDLKVGDVFTHPTEERPWIRIITRQPGVNAVSADGMVAMFSGDQAITHYPNAVLDMGQPS